MRPSRILTIKLNRNLQKEFYKASEEICRELKVTSICGPLKFGHDITKKDFRRMFGKCKITAREMRLNAIALDESARNGPSY
jgi:hypothetical protein